ncbi:22592_t:CDS:2, partial [Racocetra persica]
FIMTNRNQSTPLSSLINQLAPLIQQLQTALTQSQAISHQPLTQNTPYRTPRYWENPCPTPIYNRYVDEPDERVYSQPIPQKQCFRCRRRSPIHECPDVKRLGQS